MALTSVDMIVTVFDDVPWIDPLDPRHTDTHISTQQVTLYDTMASNARAEQSCVTAEQVLRVKLTSRYSISAMSTTTSVYVKCALHGFAKLSATERTRKTEMPSELWTIYDSRTWC